MVLGGGGFFSGVSQVCLSLCVGRGRGEAFSVCHFKLMCSIRIDGGGGGGGGGGFMCVRVYMCVWARAQKPVNICVCVCQVTRPP